MIQTLEEVVFIPLETVHAANDSVNFVYKVDGKGAIKQEVKLGIENDNYVQVLKGLEPGEELYISVPKGVKEQELISLAN
jgi:multidrug efflux pump subunit AcrA (membrane-fusion protein)